MIKNVIKVIYMKNIFKKYFGDIVSLHEIEEKPHIALFLAKRRMFQAAPTARKSLAQAFATLP